MKLVTYLRRDIAPDQRARMLAPRSALGQAGVLVNDRVYDFSQFCSWARETQDVQIDLTERPNTIKHYLLLEPHIREELCSLIVHVPNSPLHSFALNEVKLRSPLEVPTSIRDFYAFEQHVRNARAMRGSEVPPEWYQFPVFYFTNNHAVYGPDDFIPHPRLSNELDYELEVACVIGQIGRDIPASEAHAYIAGYMVMNDWSARDLQKDEMRIGLGPAKGKDFATSLGPYLVTPDELEDRRTGHGNAERYHLTMKARVNDREFSRGNLGDIFYSFPQLIERASLNAWIMPGDVIGSGTCGNGCLLEQGHRRDRYLEAGDVVELEVERLGILRNFIVEGVK